MSVQTLASKESTEPLIQTSATDMAVPVLAVLLRSMSCFTARGSSDLTGLSCFPTAASCRLIQGLMRVKRPELQNSAQPRAKANALQTRIIGTRTSATTIIAVFCLGFMAIPIQLNPILPCKTR
ncbi:hypothetical protein BDW75DRAFT_62080 [Aspergillus navahoensis]